MNEKEKCDLRDMRKPSNEEMSHWIKEYKGYREEEIEKLWHSHIKDVQATKKDPKLEDVVKEEIEKLKGVI